VAGRAREGTLIFAVCQAWCGFLRGEKVMTVVKCATLGLSNMQPWARPLSLRLRRSLLSYLRAGRISIIEAATIGGVSRQAVEKWCGRAGIDVRLARNKEVLRIAAKVRQEILQVKRLPRRGPRGKGRWVYHGKDELSEG
jgi:hypothetical protein